ncbi:MAG: hypothetical protein CSA36_06915 [Draconibacterium sp.]|nr:MAG: hypothetical protein CSA36_06915 [Draconibacterium sp.]
MATPKILPEEFLHYVWENRLFYSESLTTTEGQSIEILQLGRRNVNSGPDFFNARIKIAETLWVGNVEIHKHSSDWEKHKHNNNKAFDNVILHVVANHDKDVFRTNGEKIPVMEMHYPEIYRQNYQQLLEVKSGIPCEKQFFKVDLFQLQLGYNRLMIERLEQKTARILEQLEKNNGDWNETFYQNMARMFGFRVNSFSFELLAKSLPVRILGKHRDNLEQIEALLFGNSGLLHDELLGDDYFMALRNEYSFLCKKYKLRGIQSHLWKFMRLRPGNFPTLRIAQFAALIHTSKGLLSKIIELNDLKQLQKLFRVRASKYWDSHYVFNKPSNRKSVKELGEASANALIINVVVPFLFVYGEKQNRIDLKDRALEFLEKLPPEKNSIIANWKKMGIDIKSAFESQALIQLKNLYCETKKCLNCHIGVKLVKSIPEEK